ncbi:site-specific integrase [Microlunatus elymi]|uniref:Site-specific integrase n=1 Tax=Microlunatus elymi TaxID=2596828 RepID=A0A516PV70_9ACTN|nr:site-specific integrase [Microlunatus elymi]QDP95085.1 site-specific integrase [Microlunatus elymi]
MTPQRAHGDGSLYWNEERQRWVADVSVGYNGNGRRIHRRRFCRTKTEAKAVLREMTRELAEGTFVDDRGYTVGEAVEDWLTYGLVRKDQATRDNCRHLSEKHILPWLGARKLRELRTPEVEAWLAKLAESLSTRTIQAVRSCLNRAVRRAMAQERVRRNVVELAEMPHGRPGRPSKSLTPEQVDAVLEGTKSDRLHNYIVLSILTGARTEELRALRWDHVHLDAQQVNGHVVPPHIAVWRSVRRKGETKTPKSRRTIALPALCIEALRRERVQQAEDRLAAGSRWRDSGLVFASEVGTEMHPANVRRSFRRALRLVDGIDPEEWTPRELRHSFVSLLSDRGIPVETISMLVGHSGTTVTELVYRHQIRPVIQTGALVMDEVYKASGDELR